MQHRGPGSRGVLVVALDHGKHGPPQRHHGRDSEMPRECPTCRHSTQCWVPSSAPTPASQADGTPRGSPHRHRPSQWPPRGDPPPGTLPTGLADPWGGKGSVLELEGMNSMVELRHQQPDVRWRDGGRLKGRGEERTGCNPSMEPCSWMHCRNKVGVALTKQSWANLVATSVFLQGVMALPRAPPCNQQSAQMHESHPHDAKVSRYLLPSSKEAAVAIAATIS